MLCFFFFFSSRRRHTRLQGDWSSDVCSSDLGRALCGGMAFEDDLAGSLPDRDPLLLAHVAEDRLDLVARLDHQDLATRSEERRVGKECRSGWSAAHYRQ